jgi:hypothetical protein
MHVMNDLHLLPRLVVPVLEARLKVMPVVVVTGARQTAREIISKCRVVVLPFFLVTLIVLRLCQSV